jgi:hypothetical protein
VPHLCDSAPLDTTKALGANQILLVNRVKTLTRRRVGKLHERHVGVNRGDNATSPAKPAVIAVRDHD